MGVQKSRYRENSGNCAIEKPREKIPMQVENEFVPSFDMNGEANAGAGSGISKTDREQIKGLAHYRICPPYGTNNNKQLFKRYQRHWGFTNANGNQLPISCSYQTDRYCPVCQKVKDAEAELKRLMGDATRIDQLPADRKDAAKAIDEFIYKFKVQQFFAYNAVTHDGRVVILELKWTPHKNIWGDDKDFVGRIKEAVAKYKFDPTSLRSGVWFTFNKSGTGLGTMYPVDFKKTVTTLSDGQQAEVLDKTPLSAELIAKIEAQMAAAGPGGVAPGPLFDIHTLMEPMTAAQLTAIMNGAPIPGRGKPAAAPAPAAPSAPTVPTSFANDIPDPSQMTGGGQPSYVAPQVPATPPVQAATPVMTSFSSPATAPAAPAAPTAPAQGPAAGNMANEIARLRALQASRKATTGAQA
jgi:hypothetical protein